jgi:hypothetical protein
VLQAFTQKSDGIRIGRNVHGKCLLLGLWMGASTLFAQSAARLDLGWLQTGAAGRL